MMALPRRALISITSAHAELFEGGGHTTGVFIGEALHPYNVFKAAGFEVDIASEKGVWKEDWLSLQTGFLTTEEREQYDNRNSEFRKDMGANIKAADVLDREVCIGWVHGKSAAADDWK
jgi:putative intracellular protease/amidase